MSHPHIPRPSNVPSDHHQEARPSNNPSDVPQTQAARPSNNPSVLPQTQTTTRPSNAHSAVVPPHTQTTRPSNTPTVVPPQTPRTSNITSVRSDTKISEGIHSPKGSGIIIHPQEITDADEPPVLAEFKVSPQLSEDFDERFGPLSVEVQQAVTAILMLESPEQNIVIDALKALQKFLKKCDDNKELYVEMGGLPPIQRKMFDAHTEIQELSMKILALSSVTHKAKLFIRDLELIKDLLTLCEKDDDVIVEYATFVIANLSTLYTGRLQIIQKETLPTLIPLLSHTDPDIQRNVLNTTWQLSADPLQTGLIANEEHIGALLNLVNNSEYPPLQGIALMILEKLASLPEGLAALESLDAFTSLTAKIANETMVDLHRYCLKIFFHECRDRRTCKKYVTLVPAIVDIIERTRDETAKVNAMELLGRLCSVEHVAKGLTQCGIPQMLFKILTNEEADVKLKEACALIMAQIARTVYSAKKEFAECLPTLLAMIKSESTSPMGLKCCLIAVSSILEDASNTIEHFQKGSGFEVYKTLLEKPEEHSIDVVVSALDTIDAIAGSPLHRSTVTQANCIPTVLKFFQNTKSEQIQVTACNIICNILCEPSTHGEFLSLKGPEMLLSIIDHEEFPVVSAAVPIINVACSNPTLGDELLKLGLLKAMWKRSDLISRNGPLRAAFDRLVSVNLTLKYALVGHLSPFETVESGFCDIGGLKLIDDLKLPTDYTWEGRKRNEKVLMLIMGESKLDEEVVQNNPILGQGESAVNDIISSITSSKESFDNEFEMVDTIAKAVSDRFGGPLDKWRVTANTEDLEIEALQNQSSSVIVPVTSLTTGSYRSRALVFKAVCDACGVPCSLETADYKKAWNVVLLRPDEDYMSCTCVEGSNRCDKTFVYTENLRKYVVDLVFSAWSRLAPRVL